MFGLTVAGRELTFSPVGTFGHFGLDVPNNCAEVNATQEVQGTNLDVVFSVDRSVVVWLGLGFLFLNFAISGLSVMMRWVFLHG